MANPKTGAITLVIQPTKGYDANQASAATTIAVE
jgi:hypothetical protein